jgi:hypothetical protein
MRAGTPPEGAGDPIEAIEPLVTRDGGTSLKTPARSVYTRLVNQGRIPRRRRCGRRTAGRYHPTPELKSRRMDSFHYAHWQEQRARLLDSREPL